MVAVVISKNTNKLSKTFKLIKVCTLCFTIICVLSLIGSVVEQLWEMYYESNTNLEGNNTTQRITTTTVMKTNETYRLCEECMKIVQQAQPIDISFVRVRTKSQQSIVPGDNNEDNSVIIPPPHPHMGGRDEDGNWDYVADETNCRTNRQPFTTSDFNFIAGCKNHDSNFQMLTKQVTVNVEYDNLMKDKPRPKLFCVVYTIEQSHDRIPFIRQTWGPKCDGFIVASNKTDHTIDAVDIPHEGTEEYGNIWQKVRSIWSYVYDNYYETYDWFHIGGDDLFVIVENLRYYLESTEIQMAQNGGKPLQNDVQDSTTKSQFTIQTPLFLGRRFAYLGKMDEIFNSGGSGYTINKAALKTLVVKGFATYFPHLHTFSEDTMVARTFKKYGVVPYETKDENGSERYMPFTPGHHLTYRLPKNPSQDWYATYSINIKEGYEHCSKYSIAFHYVKGPVMKRFYAILYGLCPK